MFYTPKCCSECGNEIEPDGLKFLPNRFCEICAPNFKWSRFTPLIWMTLGLIGIIYGFGIYLKKPDRQLNLSTTATANASNKNQNSLNDSNSQVLTNNVVQLSSQKTDANNVAVQSNLQISSAVSSQKSLGGKKSSAENEQNPSGEAIYICGAQTKKGTACMRRVKGGGRCWQHQGQPAILPPEKLLVSR